MIYFTDRKTIMAEWDKWREYIANGGKGSWPSDAFESLLDHFDEVIEKAKAAPEDRTMNTFETSIHRQLVKEKESIFERFSFFHDQAKEDALAALKKLQFCIDYMESEGETKAAPED